MTDAFTGRLLVLLSERSVRMSVAALRRAAGPRIATTLDVRSGVLTPEQTEGADAVFFDRLGVALVNVDPRDAARTARIRTAAAENAARILAVEPERVVHAYAAPRRRAAAAPAASERAVTWGLQATGVPASKYTGKGVKVAVLDTGFDLRHPDFPSRSVTAVSFVPGYKAQDGHGHGTHCIGTACGPRSPFQPPRYGIAYESAILAGKVLDDNGGGADGGILAGINWAIAQGARVVSMSLGAEVRVDTPFSEVFESVGKRALAAGTLIVAAAGNESSRHEGWHAPVGHPANCPSILAVGAIDAKMQLGDFSNRGLNPKGGQVDVVAPGVDVLSAFPMPARTRRLSGTSMATPHVAGLVALWAEANPKATATELWTLLTQHARRLPLLSTDVGAGLATAP
ncbi:MAG: S8 family serine peptidase [Thermoanaerobaculia bacterium]